MSTKAEIKAFLDRREAQAIANIRGTAQRGVNVVKRALNPADDEDSPATNWVRKRPLATLGGALALGFLAVRLGARSLGPVGATAAAGSLLGRTMVLTRLLRTGVRMADRVGLLDSFRKGSATPPSGSRSPADPFGPLASPTGDAPISHG